MRLREFLLTTCVLLPLASTVSPGDGTPDSQPRPVYKSPLGLAVDKEGKRAYVALNTAGTVAVVDLQAGKVLREIPVGKKPHDVALAGKSLFVTCERDDTLVRIDVEKQAVTGRWKTGQSPRGVAVSSDGSFVVVACHDTKELMSIPTAKGQLKSAEVQGWPDQPDGFTTLSKGIGEAVLNFGHGGALRLSGISNPRGIRHALLWRIVVHQKPRTRVPATQVAQGWIFTNALSTYGGLYRSAWTTVHIDEPTRGFADPSDIEWTPSKKYLLRLFVSCAGADEAVVLKALRMIASDYNGPNSADLNSELGTDDLSLSRTYVAGHLSTQSNPRRLAINGNEDGKTLVTSNYLADSLTVIDAEKLKVIRHIPLGGPKPDAARRGEILFNSGKMTFQGQFTCASCHPDGGSDGLNWDLARDGIGNFVNTRSLLGVKDTAPYGWHGTSATLADRVAGTLRTLHRHEPQGTEVDDIVAYLQTLEPPRPLPQKEKDRPARERGKLVFEGKGKCIQCHLPPVFDDQTAHDVGTRVDGDIKAQFDTPSLRGLGRTAPYLHHGQAETLEEVFSKYNPQRRHGTGHLLAPAELADLVVYLKSL